MNKVNKSRDIEMKLENKLQNGVIQTALRDIKIDTQKEGHKDNRDTELIVQQRFQEHTVGNKSLFKKRCWEKEAAHTQETPARLSLRHTMCIS